MKLTIVQKFTKFWKERSLPALQNMKRLLVAKVKTFVLRCVHAAKSTGHLPPWPLVWKEGETYRAAEYAKATGHPVICLKRNEALDRVEYEFLCHSWAKEQEPWF